MQQDLLQARKQSCKRQGFNRVLKRLVRPESDMESTDWQVPWKKSEAIVTEMLSAKVPPNQGTLSHIMAHYLRDNQPKRAELMLNRLLPHTQVCE